MKNVEIFFSKLFSSVILDNFIVNAILKEVMQKVTEFNDKLDWKLNRDI